MTPKNFYNKLTNKLQEQLGPEWTTELCTDILANNGKKKIVIAIGRRGTTVYPRISLEAYFEEYMHGREMGTIIEDILNTVQKAFADIPTCGRTASSPAAGLRRRCGTSGRGRHLPLGHRNSSRPPPIFQWAAVSSWRKWFCTRNPYCFLRFTIFLRKFYKILEILFPACRFAYIMLERSIHDRIGPAVPDGLEYWERKAQLWTFSPSLPSAAAWRSSCTA